MQVRTLKKLGKTPLKMEAAFKLNKIRGKNQRVKTLWVPRKSTVAIMILVIN